MVIMELIARFTNSRSLLWGRPFDFWGGAGEGRGLVWVISEKNILQTDFEGKNYCKETPGEKKISYTEKKCYTFACQRKIYHQRFGKTNFYPIQITRTPLKSQIIARLLIQPSVLAPRHYGHFDRRKVPGGEERGEVDVLAG